MLTQNQLKNDIQSLANIKVLVRVFEDVAANQMNKTRKSIEQAREFNEDISQMYSVVTHYAKKGSENKSNSANKGLVLITTNTGLHGTIGQEVFTLFKKHLESGTKPSKIVVLGQLGDTLIKRDLPHLKYTFFPIKEDGVDLEVLSKVLDELADIDVLTIFHGKFESITRQTPSETKLDSQNPPVLVSNTDLPKGDFLFEPSLEQLNELFTQEIFGSIFQHAMGEASLGAQAARIMQLDDANYAIDKQVKQLELEKVRLAHQIANRKQSTRTSRIKLIRHA